MSVSRILPTHIAIERVLRIAGSFDRRGRLEKLGGFHLREYSRKSRLRKYYHRYVVCVKLCV